MLENGQPEPRWQGLAALAAVVGALGGMILVGLIAPQTQGRSTAWVLWLAAVPIHVAALAAALAVLCRATPRGWRLASLGLRSGSSLGRFASDAGTMLVWVYPLVAAMTGATVLILGRWGYQAAGVPLIRELARHPTVSGWMSLAVVAVLVAPVAEEILFRCVCYEALKVGDGKVAAVATSVLFAAIHQVPEQVPGLFVLGLVLQRARGRHGTLWVPILLHAGFNAMSVTFLAAFRSQMG